MAPRLAPSAVGVHHVDFGEHHPDEHRVNVEVIDDYAQGEVVVVLNKHEAKAVPVQRVGVARTLRCHSSVVIGRAWSARTRCRSGWHGAPDEVVGVGVLEPTAIGVVPAQMCVDDVGHGAEVAPTGYLPCGDTQPRHVEALVCVPAIGAKMFALHVAGRHLIDRRLPGFFQRCSRRVHRSPPSLHRVPTRKSSRWPLSPMQALCSSVQTIGAVGIWTAPSRHHDGAGASFGVLQLFVY